MGTLATNYVSIEDVAKDVNVEIGDGRYDLIQTTVLAVENLIDEYTGRTFTKSPDDTVRLFNNNKFTDEFYVGDYVSLSKVEIKQSEDEDWQEIEVLNQPTKTVWNDVNPFTRIKAKENFPCDNFIENIRLTGTFGWPEVPYPIRNAARIQAVEFYALRNDGLLSLHPEVKVQIERYRIVEF